ncbi:hypothetical protein IWX78_001167 [Mycetocola sp. CAN_C7]|uniref:hypothetical protein n=1 Tax=Mycetocola sp. CAN_C7 TaxID=2787724 RepID=UPI0018CA0E02
MNELDFRPKTKGVPARLIRVGQVVMESYEHPCKVVEINDNPVSKYRIISARYVWQRDSEPPWRLGTFHPEALLERAI